MTSETWVEIKRERRQKTVFGSQKILLVSAVSNAFYKPGVTMTAKPGKW